MKHFFILFVFLLIGQVLPAQFSTVQILSRRSGNAETIIQSNRPTRFIVAGKGDKYAQISEVNRIGLVFRQRNFKSVIGVAERSEFTDVVNNGNGYTLVGDCDSCIAGDPGRKLLLMKTDTLFNVQRVVRLSAPTGSEVAEEIFGWQKLVKDGDNYLVATQLSKIVANDTTSNIALTKLNANLDTLWHRRYDWNRFDNLGDLQVRDGNYYLLTWGISYFGIGGDSSYLHVVDTDGDVLKSYTYTGVGLTLSSINNSSDWVMGGALTSDLVNGPDCLLRRIDSDGNVVKQQVWGTPRIDAVRDVVPTEDGNLLIASTFWQNYPDLATILANDNYLSYQDIEYPHVAKVQRVNSTSLAITGVDRQVPGAPSTAIIVRSLVPINANGSYFVSCGYRNNKNMLFSYTEDGAGLREEPSDVKIPFDFTAKVYPNPVMQNEAIQFEIQSDFLTSEAITATLVDMTGRIIQTLDIPTSGMYQFEASTGAGYYTVYIASKDQTLEAIKVFVQN